METPELSQVYGAPVLVQMRESVALAAPGARQEYVPIGPLGQPSFGQHPQRGFVPVGEARPRAIVDREESGEHEGEAKYSYTFEAMILPTSGERVQVCYENRGKMVVMYVRPSDILAVSVISEKPDAGIIAKP